MPQPWLTAQPVLSGAFKLQHDQAYWVRCMYISVGTAVPGGVICVCLFAAEWGSAFYNASRASPHHVKCLGHLCSTQSALQPVPIGIQGCTVNEQSKHSGMMWWWLFAARCMHPVR